MLRLLSRMSVVQVHHSRPSGVSSAGRAPLLFCYRFYPFVNLIESSIAYNCYFSKKYTGSNPFVPYGSPLEHSILVMQNSYSFYLLFIPKQACIAIIGYFKMVIEIEPVMFLSRLLFYFWRQYYGKIQQNRNNQNAKQKRSFCLFYDRKKQAGYTGFDFFFYLKQVLR